MSNNKEEKPTELWIWFIGFAIAWTVFGKGCQSSFNNTKEINTSKNTALQNRSAIVDVQEPETEEFGCPDGCTYHKEGCDIKGNVVFNSTEKIYHLPEMEYYDETVINPGYGERWFCTEVEAVENGWRKSKSY